jgi:hypothetical protein
MGWTVRGSNLDRSKKFLNSQKCPDRLWGPPSLLLNWHRSSFNYSPSSIAEVKNAWGSTSTSTYSIFRHGVDKKNFNSAVLQCIEAGGMWKLKGPYNVPRSIGLKRMSTVIGHSIRSGYSSWSDVLYLTCKAERITSGALWQKGSGLNTVIIDTLKIIGTGYDLKSEIVCRASDVAACRFWLHNVKRTKTNSAKCFAAMLSSSGNCCSRGLWHAHRLTDVT